MPESLCAAHSCVRRAAESGECACRSFAALLSLGLGSLAQRRHDRWRRAAFRLPLPRGRRRVRPLALALGLDGDRDERRLWLRLGYGLGREGRGTHGGGGTTSGLQGGL